MGDPVYTIHTQRLPTPELRLLSQRVFRAMPSGARCLLTRMQARGALGWWFCEGGRIGVAISAYLPREVTTLQLAIAGFRQGAWSARPHTWAFSIAAPPHEPVRQGQLGASHAR